MARLLLAVEVKTVIADVQELLGGLHMKQRIALGEAQRFVWDPVAVVPMLIVMDGTTNRRRVNAHARLFAGLALRHAAMG